MAHIHEKIDFTISVYIVQDAKILLHKHKKLGMWLPPGGHIELTEDPTEAAIREVQEETGLDVALIGNARPSRPINDRSRDLLPPMFINRHPITDAHEHIDLIYFAKVVGGKMRPEEEGGEIGWFSKDEIEQNTPNLVDGVRVYSLTALAHFEKSSHKN